MINEGSASMGQPWLSLEMVIKSSYELASHKHIHIFIDNND